MGGCANCFISFAILSVWLAFACCVAALFAPTWMSWGEQSDPSSSWGIFLRCSAPYSSDNRDCAFYDDDLGAFWLAIRIMWPIATGLLLFCSIGACFMCCDTCRKPWWYSTLGVACFLAFGLIVATVVVYGIKYPEKVLGVAAEDAIDLFDRDRNVFFDWAYYLAIGGGCLSLLAFVFFDIAICCLRSN